MLIEFENNATTVKLTNWKTYTFCHKIFVVLNIYESLILMKTKYA